MPFTSLPSPPTLFPTYLVPSLPFRRRQSSTDSNACSPTSSSPSSPISNDSYLSGHASHLCCARCLSDLALSNQIISKGFTGRHGRAYLVAPSPSAAISTANTEKLPTANAKNRALPNLPNTYAHKPVPRQLVTGGHTVGDIACAQCGSVLGWKYVAAEAEEQKYKVGKFILETKRICRSSTWESSDEAGDAYTSSTTNSRRRSSVLPPKELPIEESVEFDSQDEDECDALFAGQWTPQFAREIRGLKKRRYIPMMDE